MKRNRALKALLGSVVMAFAALSQAQDAAPAASPSASDPASGGPAGLQGNDMERLAEALELTDAQVAQIKTIFQTSAGQFKAIEEDSSLAQDQKSQQVKALKDNINQQINSVLTPGQQQKFSALLQPFLTHHMHRR